MDSMKIFLITVKKKDLQTENVSWTHDKAYMTCKNGLIGHGASEE